MEFSKDFDGKRLILRCHEMLKPQAEWLFNLIAEVAEEKGPVVFRGGYKIQVGWSILTIALKGQNQFEIQEPDYSGDPFHKVREDITCTLGVQAQMNDFTRKVGATPLATCFQDKIIYSKGCLGEHRIYMERSPPEPCDSGWFIGKTTGEASHDDPSRLEACYTYELLKLRPEIMKVLQLPDGYLVVFDGAEVEAVIDPRDQTVFSR